METVMSQPRYRTIAANLRQDLMQGVFAVGERLPGEVALAERLSVCRQTIREALSLLADEGLVVPRKGSGWWVAERITSAQGRVRVVGCVLREDNAESEAMLGGLIEVLEPNGFQVRTLAHDGVSTGRVDLHAVDGLAAVVFHGATIAPATRRMVHALNIPGVAIGSQNHDHFDCVDLDYAHGAQALVEKAIRLGHRRILLTYTTGDQGQERARFGYESAIQPAGLTATVVGLKQGLTHAPDVVGTIVRHLRAAAQTLEGDPTCWMAIGEVAFAHRVRTLLPDRWRGISVVGFGVQAVDPAQAPYQERITMAVLPWREAGRAAGARLLAKFAIPGLAPSLTLIPPLQQAGSSLTDACPDLIEEAVLQA
jgi:GntR family transcriptional regulator, arabinose operon transcriptional repressor